MKKTISFIFIISVFFGFLFSFPVYSRPIEPPNKIIKIPRAEMPETIDEAKVIGEDFLNFMPGQIKEGWGIAINIWKNMYLKSVFFFNSNIKPVIKSLWKKTEDKSREKIDEKKDILKEELIKEKEEVKKTIEEKSKSVSKSIWQIILEKIGLKKTDKD